MSRSRAYRASMAPSALDSNLIPTHTHRETLAERFVTGEQQEMVRLVDLDDSEFA